MVTYPYAYMTYIVSPLASLGGGISWRPPAYSLLTVIIQHDHAYNIIIFKDLLVVHTCRQLSATSVGEKCRRQFFCGRPVNPMSLLLSG